MQSQSNQPTEIAWLRSQAWMSFRLAAPAIVRAIKCEKKKPTISNWINFLFTLAASEYHTIYSSEKHWFLLLKAISGTACVFLFVNVKYFRLAKNIEFEGKTSHKPFFLSVPLKYIVLPFYQDFIDRKPARCLCENCQKKKDDNTSSPVYLMLHKLSNDLNLYILIYLSLSF